MYDTKRKTWAMMKVNDNALKRKVHCHEHGITWWYGMHGTRVPWGWGCLRSVTQNR
jgi:hypothetical protein